MSSKHNFLALQVSDKLLMQIRAGYASWIPARLTTKTIRWQSMADWPRPDMAFEDRTTKSSLALEFKPPKQTKREYITGLGQACTYLKDFEYSGLIVPDRADDGYPIAEYLSDLLENVASPLPIALFSYGSCLSDITPLRSLCERENPPISIPRGIGKKKFWAYWRDVSNYELLEMLRIADQLKKPIFDKIFDRFWAHYACKGKAKNWEGQIRSLKRPAQKSYSGEKTNAYLALRHTGLLDSKANLTAQGYRLLHTGRIYGADSSAFIDLLAYNVLTEGQHVELIFWLEKAQRNIVANKKKKAETFYKALDQALADEGIIPPRPKISAKPTFLRDEFKLWNKLGLLEHGARKQYFHSGYGLAFDWRKIVSIIESHAGYQ